MPIPLRQKLLRQKGAGGAGRLLKWGGASMSVVGAYIRPFADDVNQATLVSVGNPIRYPMPRASVRQLRVNVINNALTGAAATLGIFRNGLATPLFVTVPAGALGIFTNLAPVVLFNENDTIDFILSHVGAIVDEFFYASATVLA